MDCRNEHKVQIDTQHMPKKIFLVCHWLGIRNAPFLFELATVFCVSFSFLHQFTLWTDRSSMTWKSFQYTTVVKSMGREGVEEFIAVLPVGTSNRVSEMAFSASELFRSLCHFEENCCQPEVFCQNLLFCCCCKLWTFIFSKRWWESLTFIGYKHTRTHHTPHHSFVTSKAYMKSSRFLIKIWFVSMCRKCVRHACPALKCLLFPSTSTDTKKLFSFYDLRKMSCIGLACFPRLFGQNRC